MVDLLGPDRGGRQDRAVVGVERQPRQVDTARLEAARIGGVAEHVARDIVGDREVARDVPLAEARVIALRGEHAALVSGHRAGRLGRGGAAEHRSRAGRHHRHIVARLAIVVDAKTRRDLKLVGDVPGQLAERRRRGVGEADRVDRGQAVQHRRVPGVGAGRVEQIGAGGGTLHLQALHVDGLTEIEQPCDVIDAARTVGGDTQLLRHLILLRLVGRHRGDRQPDIVAVAVGDPVPEAVGGH